jgi:hypothetical protein
MNGLRYCTPDRRGNATGQEVLLENELRTSQREYLMNKYRTKLLIAMQLCSLPLSTLFVLALGTLEGSMAMLWVQELCSRAAARPR